LELGWAVLYQVNFVVLLITFLALAILHVYWAFGGNFGHGSVIPTVQGQPMFMPSFWGTMTVAFALFLVAVALLAMGSSVSWIRLSSLAAVICTSLVLVLRSIGEFELIGFFKTQSDSRFAQMDTWFYSPLCLALAVMMTCLIMFDSGR
jgi:hypothetical protein